jgi:hypothetical protein
MSIEDDLSAFSETERGCFGLMSALVAIAAAQYDPESTQKSIDLLSRYPHVLSLVADTSDKIVADIGRTDFGRRLLRPGPTGVVDPDLPKDDDGG